MAFFLKFTAFFLFVAFLAPVQGYYWTASVSEEQGELYPAVCDYGLAAGIHCSGRYCDNVALKCSDGSTLEESVWTVYFSDEHQHIMCPDKTFVSGLRCSGRYCDNISMRCSKSNFIPTGDCFWSVDISEENGGVYELAIGEYIRGMECFDDYCDDKKLYICKSSEVKPVCDSYDCPGEWTVAVSEEDAAPAVCERGPAMGIRCSGDNCDDVSLKCSAGVTFQESLWTDYFSDGQLAVICPDDMFVTGLHCSGRFCDDISLRCTRSEVKPTDDCFWTPRMSEEHGGTFEVGPGQFIRGMECFGDYCDDKTLYVCSSSIMIPVCSGSIDCERQMAERFAPVLRFDQAQGGTDKCFPSDAEYYWTQRKNGNSERICLTNYQELQNGNVPTYYEFASCGNNIAVIKYWWFYAFQDDCFLNMGSHDADWEHVVVKIVDGVLTRALFSQHGGHYTRVLGNFEREGDHLYVYSGKDSHGNYHDDGGTGTCLYFEDWRNPKSNDYRLRTWENLVRLTTGPDAPEWMDPDRGGCGMYFDGNTPPTCRSTAHFCAIPGCDGTDFELGTTLCFGQCGCAKSDIGNDPF